MKKLLFIFFISVLYFGANAQSWSLTGNAGTNPPTNYIGTSDCEPLIFKTYGIERMRLSKDMPALGIGTSDPLAPLHVHNRGRYLPCNLGNTAVIVGGIFPLMQFTTVFSTSGFTASYDDSNNFFLTQNESANFTIEGVGGGLTITPNGNIGIGTSIPQAKLDVAGSLKATSATISGALNAQSACFNGSVSIGSYSSAINLDVIGKIRAEEIKVCLNHGCDYVFEEDYSLMNLNDLNTFIKTHRHLPDVAPAAVMEAEGINLSEMNALLLRKVEELTLYIIQIENRLAEIERKDMDNEEN